MLTLVVFLIFFVELVTFIIIIIAIIIMAIIIMAIIIIAIIIIIIIIIAIIIMAFADYIITMELKFSILQIIIIILIKVILLTIIIIIIIILHNNWRSPRSNWLPWISLRHHKSLYTKSTDRGQPNLCNSLYSSKISRSS